MEKYQEVERSIITTYRKKIWGPFIRAIKEYNLISPNDHICCCMSGGKDSFLMAKLLEELEKHSDFPFKVTYLVMNPGYKPEVQTKIENNLMLLNINAIIVKSDIFEIADLKGGKPCFLCARMRRGFLYKKAIELGCNKIALGHHFDDVIETTLMSMFYNGRIQTMPPKLLSDNYNGMELIRPMYQIHEQDILNWQKFNDLSFINCACKFTDSNTQFDSKRKETKELVKELKKINPIIPNNIFQSVHRCNIDTLVGYELDRNYISFNEEYERKKQMYLKDEKNDI